MPLLLSLRFWEQPHVPARARIASIIDAWYQQPSALPQLPRHLVPDAPPVLGNPRPWLATVAEWHRAPAPLLQPQRFAPPSIQPPGARAWLPTVIDSWRSPGVPQLPLRGVPEALAPPAFVPFARPWFATVVDAWRPAVPQPQSPPKTPLIGDLAFVPRRPRIAIMEAWSQVEPQAMPRRYAQEAASVFDPRRWIGTVLDWWRALDPFGQHPARQPQPGPEVTVPPVPEPVVEVCFPPVAAPVTAFSREVAPSTGFSRTTVTGTYSRAALGALAPTRSGAPAASFSHVAAPTDVPSGTGWGDSYGDDYGGSGVAGGGGGGTPATVFDREAGSTSTYARASFSGAPFVRLDAAAALAYEPTAEPELAAARVEEPGCVPQMGYGGTGGDGGYGFDYGGSV